MDIIKKYIDENYETSGRYIQLAMDRFLSDLTRKDLKFNEDKVKKVIKFMSMCKMWKGVKAGEPFPIQPHQIFFIGQLFGWQKETEDGWIRRFKSTYKQISRKNGKTSEGALIALFHITADDVIGAQAWVGANKEEQARILVNDAGQIVRSTKELSKHYRTWDFKGTINRVHFGRTRSTIAALGRDSKTQDGFDPSLGIIDEYHEAPDDRLLNVIESGMGARKEPMMCVITTAGFNKQGPCYSNLRRTGIDVLEGRLDDDSYLPLIFELDEDDDWEDEQMWYKSNPNLGVGVYVDYLRTRFVKAKNEGGTKEVDFKTKNLNMWTDSSSTWISDEIWKQNGDQPTNSDVWFLGADLGSVSDYTAVVLISLPDGEGIINVIPYFWIPEGKIQEKQSTESINIRKWINDGNLKVTSGDTTDFNEIEAFIKQLSQERNIHALGFDPHQAVQMMTNLQNVGLNVVKVPQNYTRLSEPAKTIEKLSRERKLRHGNHPVLSWHRSNAVITVDNNNNYRVIKENPENKIDGMSAFMNAVAVWQNEYQESSFIIDSW